MTDYYAYQFEAKSIQSYIFDSGRLKDIIGASELIESLCTAGGLLDDVTRTLGLTTDDVEFSRRAGGAFVAILRQAHHAQQLRDVWSLVVQQYAPGLEYIHALGAGETAYAAVEKLDKQLKAARNRQQAMLPQPGPLSVLCPRTGKPAFAYDRAKGELLDRPTASKRNKAGQTQLVSKFQAPKEYVWPKNLEKDGDETDNATFPFVRGELANVGIVHADGNGLGQLLRTLRDKVKTEPARYVELFRAFSTAIEDATLQAARHATHQVIVPNARNNVLPARPVVLGGDDITVIVRGDLCVPFAAAFMEEFEIASEQQIGKLKREFAGLNLDWPHKLSACAGIAIIKPSQPFHMAYALAESLCAYAKKGSKQQITQSGIAPSSLAFHVVKSAMIDDFGELLERELTIRTDTVQRRLSLQPYGVGSISSKLPALRDLNILVDVLQSGGASQGPLRQLMGLLHFKQDEAEKRYARWRSNLEKASGVGEKAGVGQFLGEFDTAMHSLLGEMPHISPFAKNVAESNERSTVWHSPLGDAMAYLKICGFGSEGVA